MEFRDGSTAVYEKVTQFGLSCIGHDGFDDLCDGDDDAIVRWNGGVVRYEEVSTVSAVCFCFREVLSITVVRKNHVACVVCDDCIRMGGGIV